MKRFFLGFGIFVGVLLATAPATMAQSVNNFKIHSFEAEYFLSQDNDGRSVLKTVEKIKAEFPNANQNHGLERAIPTKYDGHSTNVKIESIQDETGRELAYSDTTVNDNLVLRIGDADEYVHGEKIYVITYIQHDVTKYFSDTGDDEFYWDVNGTQWAQPMGQVNAKVYVSEALQAKLNSQARCYEGAQGSTKQCLIENKDGVFSLAATNLAPYENITFAIGFQPHTFAEYQPTAAEKIMAALFLIWSIIQFISIPVALIVVVVIIIRFLRTMNRAKGRGGIVTVEYLPPKDTSVLTSSVVLKNVSSDITAQLIDLAVRHYLKIYQTKEKGVFKSAEYELEIVRDTSDLLPEEARLIKNLFGSNNIQVGARFALKTLKNNTELAKRLLKGREQLKKDARGSYALFERAETEAGSFKKIGFFLVVIGVVLLSPLLLITASIAFICAALAWPLTEKGAQLRDYLTGLKEYISVAEAERIKMLQSPEGAEKVGRAVGESDTARLVKLYERVLPYAVLFGVEKEWVKQLGAYYETTNTQPDWYSGNAAFNAVIFSSALGGFNSQSSMYSSATSSSSGGSSGGGSSGGGGGGGGGGGW
jgi:uncharacterized membrane protein YgcG